MIKHWFVFLPLFLSISCASVSRAPSSVNAEPEKPVEAVILQVNDVYEITPLQQGKLGGLSRIATLKKQLKSANPNTYLVLAGDFLSPSALGVSKVDDRELRGKQMVSVLKETGMDLVIFGNHEFDIKQADMDDRIAEARNHMRWLSGNVKTPQGEAYAGLPESHIEIFRSPQGTEMRVGFIATTIAMNKRDHVNYVDPIEFAKSEARKLKPQVDILIAMTHLSIAQDMKLAEQAPEIDLIIGGHEHESMFHRRGERMIPIAKADANAKSAYVHLLKFYPASKRVVIDSHLRQVNETIVEDPAVKRVADEWVEKAFQGFKQIGFEPRRQVGVTSVGLDGLEASVRNKNTNLSEIVGRAFLREIPGDAAMFIGGSIRIDDVIPPGPITEYDIIRIMPFFGTVLSVEITGANLVEVLKDAHSKAGAGSFMLTVGMKFTPEGWKIKGRPINPQRTYTITTEDFVGGGLEKSGKAKIVRRGGDTRRSIINYMTAVMNPAKPQ